MERNATSVAANFDRNETAAAPIQGYDVLTFVSTIKFAIGVTGVLGNLLVVVVILRYKKLFQQVKSIYIINQSFIDGLVFALLIQYVFVRRSTVPHTLNINDTFCKIWHSQILLWGLMMSSTYNLMAISIERYLAIVHPMWHTVSFTKTKANAMVVFIWLFGILFNSSFIIPTSGIFRNKCFVAYFWPSRTAAAAVGMVQLVVNMIAPILVHCVCYVSILKLLRRRIVEVTPSCISGEETHTSVECGTEEGPAPSKSLTLPSTHSSRGVSVMKPRQSTASSVPAALQDLNDKAKRNVIKTLAIVTACYFICWIPSKIYVIMYMLGKISVFGYVYQATVVLTFINCCINPFIYVAKYDAFKKGLAMLFRHC